MPTDLSDGMESPDSMEQEGLDKPKKVKKKKAKKVKDPNRLTKCQKTVMDLLNTGGVVAKKKLFSSEGFKFQVTDADGGNMKWVNLKTKNSLEQRLLIYRAGNGKYYSTNYFKDNESKPEPAADGDTQQSSLDLAGQTKSKGNNNSRRAGTVKDKVKGNAPVPGTDRRRSAGNKTGKG